MKKKANRFTALIVAALFAIACIPEPAQPAYGLAAGGDDQSTQSVQSDKSDEIALQIAEQFADPSNDPFDYTQESAKKEAVRAGEDLPEAFDLRDVDGRNYVTPVKLQHPFGSCWGFAAISAAETSILGDPENLTSLTADTMDLSEKHLVYFAATPIDDPANPQNGEGMLGGKDASERCGRGGEALTATSVFSAGAGPVLESENDVFLYKGKNGIIQKEPDGDKLQDFCYSKKDDWSIPESLRFKRSFALRESYMLPSPAVLETTNTGSIYRYNEAATVAIKRQLLQKRAVEISYLADTSLPGQEGSGNYINSDFAHYTYDFMGPTHTVCVVGWDDNYAKENFRHIIGGMDETESLELTTPQGDGAWLVKNSWGSEEEEFPNHGEGNWGIVDPETGKHTGYFWLSYYDTCISVPEALDFEKINEGVKEITDQHDLMPVSEVNAANVKDTVRTANVFKAGVCEELQQVSCLTSYPDTEVTFDIYLLQEGFEKPVDGKLMDSVTETFDYGGFHKVKLENPFTVMKGQSYAIVVTQKTPEGKYAVNVQTASGMDHEGTGGTGVINKKESFLMMGGAWKDFSSKSLQSSLLRKADDKTEGMAIDNFPIKGFAVQKPDLYMYLTVDNSLEPPMPGIEETPVNVLLTFEGGADAEAPEPLNIKWTLDEGAEKLFTFKDGRTINRKIIYPKKSGRANLTVEVDGIGTIIYPIRITIPRINIEAVKTGSRSLKVTVSNLKYTGVSHYQLAYRIRGTKTWKTKSFSSASRVLKLTGLKNGKRYQVKARPWTTDAYGKYYGRYSSTELSGMVGLKNTLKVRGRTAKVRFSDVRKAAQKLSRSKVIRLVKAGQGARTYFKLSGNKKIKIAKKTGRVTVKKGLKKGVYKVKVKVKAKGNADYNPAARTVIFTIKVK
ncbi:MAG: lectin like domain-containing protein [Bacillota bacterium]|nr:lectin like domain-containing protein [Bacillota bacterium]